MHREGHLETSGWAKFVVLEEKSREAKACDGVSEKKVEGGWIQMGSCEESHSAIWLTFNE